MNFIDFFSNLSNVDIAHFFFKIFAIFFSLLYLVYSFILQRQVSDMNTTVKAPAGPLVYTITLLQIGSSIILIAWSLLLL